MSKDENYESEDDSKLDEEEYDDFESYQEERKYQCRQCLTFFTDSSDFKKHIQFHQDNYALEFIRDLQPVDGAIILSRFKQFDLVELEKAKKIKFSDEHMAWTLYDYDVKKINNKKPVKFDSISNAPCISCIYEKNCSVDNENRIANPNYCELISDWVDGKAKNRQKRIKNVKEETFENIAVAFYWFRKSKKFDFIGTLEKNKIRNSPNKFSIVDNTFKSIPIIFDYYDERKFKFGDKIKIIGTRFSGERNKRVLKANRATKVQKI